MLDEEKTYLLFQTFTLCSGCTLHSGKIGGASEEKYWVQILNNFVFKKKEVTFLCSARRVDKLSYPPEFPRVQCSESGAITVLSAVWTDKILRRTAQSDLYLLRRS